MEGALASGFAITQLHHSAGHDPQPLHAKKVEILQTSTREGFGFYNYVDALKFFEVDDKAVKVPPSIPPRGTQFYPTMGSGGPSRRSSTSFRP